MAKFKVIISDPLSGASKVLELEETRASPFIGKKIGETIDGAVVNLPAHKVQVMGGSDKDGVPMRPNVHGGIRRAIILSGGAGFKPTKKGQRKRKVVRGDIITDEIVQLNIKIVDRPAGATPLAKPVAAKTEEDVAQT
ncbi:MAG: 30S ribosomal protein S6e [Crenarchaeota archaeon]|nr:30S ribosomal protein S6e [Thermoproteota archaeon]